MDTNEIQWDKLLKIRTTGRDDSNADQFRYPYEPTPYSVLERLANSGYIGKKNILIDYGTGKGRVCFYLSYQSRCKSIGIEYDSHIFQSAQSNLESAVSGRKVTMLQESAEQYQVPVDADRMYFFNPFSIEILQKAMGRLLDSYYEEPREILLFFYYPSDEYVAWLMTQDELMFVDEINCQDLFPGNDPREKILIFEVC